MMRPVRLLLAEDHVETAQLIARLLQREFDVIGHVVDGLALVREAERLRPDVIVTDISMPHLDGIAATAAIIEQNPQARIVLLTADADPLVVQRGLAAGAMGYVWKVAAADDLVPALHAALQRERRAPPSAALVLDTHLDR
jgi:DNA-binding NarL/FixJ family response regulator